MKPKDRIYCLSSDYLRVIKIAGYTGNLALTTIVIVNTIDNTTKLTYEVRSWNDKHRRIAKSFEDYKQAYEYYIKIYDKFST